MTKEEAINFLCSLSGVDYVAILSDGRKLRVYKDGKLITRRVTKLNFSIVAGEPYETTVTRTHLPFPDVVDGDA